MLKEQRIMQRANSIVFSYLVDTKNEPRSLLSKLGVHFTNLQFVVYI